MLRDPDSRYAALLAALLFAVAVVPGVAAADSDDRTTRVDAGALTAADAMQEENETTETTTSTTETTSTTTPTETSTTPTETTTETSSTTETTSPDDGPSEATVEYVDCETVRIEGEVAELELGTTYYTPGAAEDLFFVQNLSGTTVLGDDTDVDVSPDNSADGDYAIDYVTLYDADGEEVSRVENPNPIRCDERARPDEPTTETTLTTGTQESTTSTDDGSSPSAEQSGSASDGQEASNDDDAESGISDDSDATSEEATSTTTTTESTPTATPTETTTRTTTVFETEFTGGTESQGQPGMGFAAVLLALVAVVLVAARR